MTVLFVVLIMRTLSVRQPWASLICSGIKDVENRTWAPPVSAIGEKLLIHASGKKVSEEEIRMLPFEWCSVMDNAVKYGWIPEVTDMPTGAIIGYVDLVGHSHKTVSLWDGGEELEKWIFENAYLFDKPIPAKGKLGIYDTPIDVLPPAHKAIDLVPHREGNVIVLPYSEKLVDEVVEDKLVVLDVTDENLDVFAELKGEEYVLRPTSKIQLVTSKRTVEFPVLDSDLFIDVYEDSGAPILYTSLRGEEYVKYMVAFYSEPTFEREN